MTGRPHGPEFPEGAVRIVEGIGKPTGQVAWDLGINAVLGVPGRGVGEHRGRGGGVVDRITLAAQSTGLAIGARRP